MDFLAAHRRFRELGREQQSISGVEPMIALLDSCKLGAIFTSIRCTLGQADFQVVLGTIRSKTMNIFYIIGVVVVVIVVAGFFGLHI